MTLLVLLPAGASAQDAAPPAISLTPANTKLFDAASLSRALGPLPNVRFDRPYAQVGSQTLDMKGRACAGCPRRSLATPLLDTLWLNIMYNSINRASHDATADIDPHVWWANMKSGFEWDNNPWPVNQIGHPYQGSNYFNAGRANGLGFYGSAAVAAFGSSTWEYFFENNRASFNDLINTTLGGIALGEVFHRVAWVVRDPMSEGRKKKELIALAIDPIGGLTRMVNGDAKRVTAKPPTMTPSSIRYSLAGGVMWQGKSLDQVDGQGLVIIDMAVAYGNTREQRSTVPFGSFDAMFSVGGGGQTRTGIRGRLFGTPFGGHYQFNLLQTFDFIKNPAYDYGGQGLDLEVGMTRQIFSDTTLWMAGAGGLTMLGAVNQLAPPPVIEGEKAATGGGADGSRDYDYGPGFRWSGFIQMSRASQPYFTIAYQGYHVAVVDGVRSNHVLQRLFLDARVPVRYSLSIGVAGEYFFRKAYFYSGSNGTDESPQLRAYIAWSSK
ncbi:MAG TPA: DUF3943 domain-containing protein [Vicinamibacterales bacterium]|nr:DUF3943 domain-containing protein [Vicinamibacterales bacterium]